MEEEENETRIIDWEDGHRPGATSQGTKVFSPLTMSLWLVLIVISDGFKSKESS